MSKIFPALAALAAATALIVPTVARASDVPSVRVPYGDLNLGTDLGQEVLKGRIAFAAGQLCGSSDPRDLVFARAVADCRMGTIADVEPAYEAAIAEARHGTVTVGAGAALIVTAR
jgi:UrcA family protein